MMMIVEGRRREGIGMEHCYEVASLLLVLLIIENSTTKNSKAVLYGEEGGGDGLVVRIPLVTPLPPPSLTTSPLLSLLLASI